MGFYHSPRAQEKLEGKRRVITDGRKLLGISVKGGPNNGLGNNQATPAGSD
jgi:hypothetical protein